uniref:Olfactomedin-like domain-containing protein n=1 Tax=Caenorhabditis japonica TaxID=281687 RepID=A0A8R1HRU2_CAEJA
MREKSAIEKPLIQTLVVPSLEHRAAHQWTTIRPCRFTCVVERETFNLKIVSNWSLPSIDTSSMCNAFVRCAILYSVECDGTIAPVYNFYSHTYIQGKATKWKGLTPPIGNVQYDPNSKSIAIYANSKIYKVSVFQ